MKRNSKLLSTAIIVLFVMLMTVACAASPMSAPAADTGGDASASYQDMSNSDSAEMAEVAEEEYADAASDEADFSTSSSAGDAPLQTTGLQNRKIIREATIQLEAEDVTTALNQATALSVRVGGYTMGSTSWQEAGNRQYASFSFAVPVTRFEEAIEQTRRLGKVNGESITSQDVTAQFVDVEARINNLEATAERVRGFLMDAQDLEYILEVNRELSRIEGDLESLKGQRNVLKQKTSFSRIHLDITPPPIVPTTTEILETATVWSPIGTFNSALAVLLDVLKSGADAGIWLVVMGLPVVIIGWFIWTILRRIVFSKSRSASITAPVTSSEASA